MTLAELITRVGIMVRGRSDIDSATITSAINEAYKRMATGKFIDAQRNVRHLRFPELEKRADATLVTGGEDYALPALGYAVFMVRHRYSTSPDQWLRLKRHTPAQLWNIQDQSGKPWAFTFYGNAIWLRNIPSSTYNGQTLRIWYYQVPAALTASGDSPVYNEVWHPLIALEAGRDLASRYGFVELAAGYAGEFAQHLSMLKLPHEVQGADDVTGGLLR